MTTSIEMMLAELRFQRRHVLAALDGLDEQQLCTPVPPTTWAPGAVAHHLALDVERWWFQAVFTDDAAAWAYFDANPNGAWTVPDGVDPRARYEAESAISDEVITRLGADALPAGWPAEFGAPKTLGQTVLHVIGETAAHAGQLDVVREMIDGHQHLIMD